MIAVAMTAAAFVQGVPSPPRSPEPWVGTADSMRCRVTKSDLSEVEFGLGLTDKLALLLNAQGVIGKPTAEALLQDKPPTIRRGAMMRATTFKLQDGTAAIIRQLYQGGKLVSTAIAFGKNADAAAELPSEFAMGFCTKTAVLQRSKAAQ